MQQMNKKRNKKIEKQIKITLILLVVLIVIIGIIKVKNNEIAENTENKINSNQIIRTARKELEYYVKNIALQKSDKQTILKIDVENQNPYDIEGKWVTVVFLDEKQERKEEMALYIRKIEAGETISTQATINYELKDIHNFKFEER